MDLIGIDSKKYLINKLNIKYLINYLFVFILNEIQEYIQLLQDDGSEETRNAIGLFEELEKDFSEEKEEVITQCSTLMIDLIQNIIEEQFDTTYIHENKDLIIFNQQIGKQKEREKQYLVGELTSQSNEQRLLNVEKQRTGLSNWFDNLSKQNDDYKKTDQYKTDNDEERLQRLSEISENYKSEREVYEKEGLNFDDLLQQQLEEYQQDNGYGDGKEPENDLENEADETDGYDN